MGMACPPQLELAVALCNSESWEPFIHHLWIHSGEQCLQPRPHHLPPFLCLPETPELSLSFLQKYVKMPQNLEALLSFLQQQSISPPFNLWPVALHMSPAGYWAATCY